MALEKLTIPSIFRRMLSASGGHKESPSLDGSWLKSQWSLRSFPNMETIKLKMPLTILSRWVTSQWGRANIPRTILAKKHIDKLSSFLVRVNPSNHNWLVVSTPLKNMLVSWDYEIPNIWKFIKAMFQTTNQILDKCGITQYIWLVNG